MFGKTDTFCSCFYKVFGIPDAFTSDFMEMFEKPFTFLRDLQKSGRFFAAAQKAKVSNPLQTGHFSQIVKVGTEFACIK